VFHAPQNLEKGGHGISPCTMHHLKRLFSPLGKRSVSHILSPLSSLDESDWKESQIMNLAMRIIG